MTLAEMLRIGTTCQINGTYDAAAIFAPHLAYHTEERIAVAHLDADQNLLSFSVTSDSAHDRVAAPIRAIIAEALACDAASIVIAHNHPSGIALPSDADRHVTRIIARTLKPLHIRLQDHLIFAGPQWSSFRGLGLI